MEQLIQDARQLIDYLRDRFGRDRIFLLGDSWGSEAANCRGAGGEGEVAPLETEGLAAAAAGSEYSPARSPSPINGLSVLALSRGIRPR